MANIVTNIQLRLSKDTYFQIYRQPIQNVFPEKKPISLVQFIEYTKNPPEKIRDVFNRIAAAELSDDRVLKARLKQNKLFYFTPCVIVRPKRKYESIIHFTGLLVLDFDHIDNAPDFKQYLFDQYPCIVVTWLSPSRRGVKALVSIPVVENVTGFKEYYFGIAAEMEQFNGFDTSGQNAVLPLFQSFDPDLLYRDNPEIWLQKGTKRNDFTAAVTVTARAGTSNRPGANKAILQMLNTGMSNIANYGHPPLRSLCIAIGGYIASGYIDEFEAMQEINYRIETHPYLKKGIAGYKKTAKWAIQAGMRKPLYFGNNGK